MATVFAGSLCRFFAYPDGDAAKLAPGVALWQRDLLQALGEKPLLPRPWRETADGEVLQQDLGDAGLLALRLFAFHAERTDLELPDRTPALLELDKHWRAAADAKFERSLYAQVLAPRLWLPGEFPFTFRAPLPDGEGAEIGALGGLVEQLRWLNQRTFQADAEVIESWRELPAPAGCDLLVGARRGLSGLLAAAEFARERDLPLAVREPHGA
jgi:hypothetical protein